MGAGKAEGAMDAANLLKPMLARGELRCIGEFLVETPGMIGCCRGDVCSSRQLLRYRGVCCWVVSTSLA
jgi:hypothetical protein